MTRRFRAVGAAIVLTALPALARAEGEKVDLKPHFEVGQTLTYKIEASTEGVRHSPDGQPATQKASQELTITRKVTAVDEKSATVELTITHMKLKGETQSFKVDYDSDKPDAENAQNPVAQQFKGVIGKPMTLTVGLDGEVKDLKTPEGMGPNPLGPPDAVKNQFSPLFRVKRGDPLTEVGSSWKTEDEQGAGGLGVMIISAEAKLESVKDSVADVKIEGTMKPKDPAALPNLEFKNSSLKGGYAWDVKRGITKAYTVTQKMTISGMLDMDTSTTSTMTLVE